MGSVVALDSLLESRQVWRGQASPRAPSRQPTGLAALDAALPAHGWPESALTELLLPADGVGELRLLWPTLARLSQGDGMIALVAPPYLPFAAAWAQAGLRMDRLQVVRADARDAMWAAEQCLRSAVCGAVLCWPQQANDRALRRLQVAAESGQCLGFAMRPLKEAANPSPAALRIAIDAEPAQLRVLKCRGGNAPPRPIPFAVAAEGLQPPLSRFSGASASPVHARPHGTGAAATRSPSAGAQPTPFPGARTPGQASQGRD